MEQNQINQWA